jgi:endonuclease/exonuclease/phosphatase (EEP) superfamily protein YafD
MTSRQPRRTLIGGIGRAIRNLLTAGLLLYGLALAGYLLLRLVSGERFAPVRLANSLMPPLLLAGIACGLLMLLMRRPRMALLYVPFALLFLVWYSGRYAPHASASVPEDAIRLEVMTFNMLARQAADHERGLDVVLAQDDIDILAFQEYVGEPFTSDPALLERFPHRVANDDVGTTSGNAIYSRFPLENVLFIEGTLGHMRAETVLPDGRRIAVYSAHPLPPLNLGLNPEIRSAEIGDVLALVADETLPVLLLGDFNTTEHSEDYARIDALLDDAFARVGRGLGPTWPDYGFQNPLVRGWMPLIRIDYIWYSDDFVPLEAYPLGYAGSDHHPLRASVALLTEPPG